MIERRAWYGLAALVAALVAVYYLKAILLPFVMAAALAYALNPVVNGLERLGLPRTLATALIVLGMAFAAALAMFVIVPLIAHQMKELAANVPQYLEDARQWLEHSSQKLMAQYPGFKDALDAASRELSQSWRTALAGVASGVWSSGLALLNFVSLCLITPIVMFYLLNDWGKLTARIDSYLPVDHAPTIRRLANEMNDVLAGFVRGQGTLCLVLACLYGAGLSLIGIKWGLLIGVVAGLLSFVPYVGLVVGLLTGGTMAVLGSWPDWKPLAMVAGVFAAGQVLDAALLSPRLVAGRIRLHPVWLIFALFAFAYLFGIVGVFVAVPVAALIGVLVRFGLGEYLKSSMHAGRTHADPPPGPAT